MSNPKAKTLPDVMSMFFSMFIALCIDLFLIRTDLTVLGDTVFMSVCGLIILFLYMKASKESVRVFGVSKRRSKITAGALYGSIFALVPLAFVSVVECAYLATTDITMLDVKLNTPNMIHADTEGGFTPGLASMIYLLTCFIGVFFKEIFFRGFLLKKINKAAGFTKANILQSVLYMAFVLPYIIRSVPTWLSEGKFDLKTVVLIIVFCIVHEFFAGIKWGLMTRVSGSTYMAIVDHYLYTFLSVGLFLTSQHTTVTYLIRIMSIQFISFVLVAIYYFFGMKRINKKKEKEKIKAEAELKEIEKRRKEKEAVCINEKLENVEAISPKKFKTVVTESEKLHNKTLTDESALENKIVLEEMLRGEVAHVNDESVDTILKRASREMHRREKPSKSNEITDDFDSDDFLQAYQRQDGSHRNTHKHHHHNHHRKNDKKDAETAVAIPPPKKTMARKPKRSFSQKLQSFGGVDDSSSNGFI